MGRIGFPELILILIVLVVFFGPAKLPEIGASIGRAIRQFKKSLGDVDQEIKKPADTDAK